jgi:predicted DNA-binding transcriptional regulator AlpA
MEKTVFISLPINELQSVIIDCVNACLRNSKYNPSPPKADRCNFSDALEITGLSKSALYKKTASNDIHHKRFTNRLIFSRKELLEWVESQTVEKNGSSEACLALAKSARNKNKKG